MGRPPPLRQLERGKCFFLLCLQFSVSPQPTRPAFLVTSSELSKYLRIFFLKGVVFSCLMPQKNRRELKAFFLLSLIRVLPISSMSSAGTSLRLLRTASLLRSLMLSWLVLLSVLSSCLSSHSTTWRS